MIKDPNARFIEPLQGTTQVTCCSPVGKWYTPQNHETNSGSDYLDWVKTRQPARFNPAASGLLPCTVADLAGGRGDIQINGSGSLQRQG
jgi:hypothetical protein